MSHTDKIAGLFTGHFQEEPDEVVQLPQAGSDRIYYRLKNSNHQVIGTYSRDKKENKTFLYLGKHFYNKGIPVPRVLAHSDDYEYYLQEDLGDVSLYSLVRRSGITDEIIALYKKTIDQLVVLQIDGAEGLDFQKCYPIQIFNRSSMFWDLNSFKYYFARIARAHFNEVDLNRDFHYLCDFLLDEPNQYFMYRDCQSRNICIKDDRPYFIDFQGGRKGPLQYDIAALLWQAGARIPYEIRDNLFDYYMDKVSEKIALDKTAFKERYYGFVLIRMLQVLGAYGFRGLIERRSHFLESIIPALENIQWFMKNIPLKIKLPEVDFLLRQLIKSDVFQYSKIDGSEKPLLIEVNSFSFRRGIPKEESGNGGGFVFDCRGIHNPGRYEPYKHLTGLDKPVIEFLETQSQVKEFLDHVWQAIDLTVESYLERDFEHLQINFGCTGGQHRSVYCAEQTARHLQEKYKAKVILKHIEREIAEKESK
jgi:aminoglycoside/choline kinase family phosphotransferase